MTVAWPKDSDTAVAFSVCESGLERMQSNKYGLNVKKSQHLAALVAMREQWGERVCRVTEADIALLQCMMLRRILLSR